MMTTLVVPALPISHSFLDNCTVSDMSYFIEMASASFEAEARNNTRIEVTCYWPVAMERGMSGYPFNTTGGIRGRFNDVLVDAQVENGVRYVPCTFYASAILSMVVRVCQEANGWNANYYR